MTEFLIGVGVGAFAAFLGILGASLALTANRADEALERYAEVWRADQALLPPPPDELDLDLPPRPSHGRTHR